MIIGVDLGGTNVRAGLVVKSKLTKLNSLKLTDTSSRQKTLNEVIQAIAPLMRHEVKGIGIGVPSVIDLDKGIVYDVVNILSWKKVPLKSILQKEFGKPVYINNDANCFILGEHRYGIGKPYSMLVGLTLGTGLGAGIIINQQLYNGRNCGAGEIGMLPYLDKNFEFYGSSSYFISTYTLSAAILHEKAMSGNADALKIWNEYGKHLGNVVKEVMYMYDPEAIILGGSISKAFDFFKEAMSTAMQDFIYPGSVKKLKILQSKEEHIAVLGAAALAD